MRKAQELLGKSSLEEALLCNVINYTILSDLPSMKIKIAKRDLFRALSANKKLIKVRLWKNARSSYSGKLVTFQSQPGTAGVWMGEKHT